MDNGPKHILVVEDDPEIARLTERVLQDKGFRTRVAADGLAGLAAVKSSPPDLVLLDIDLPGVDGWGFLDQVGSPRPAVVFVSGLFSFDAFARGTRSGVAAFVAKPIHYKELIATLQRIFKAPPKRAPTPGDQRRRAERKQLLVRVDVISDKGTSRAVGELCDLSVGGAQVITISPLDVGARVRFALDTAVTGPAMKFESEVRWRQPLADGFAHGLELVDVGPELTERLYAVLA